MHSLLDSTECHKLGPLLEFLSLPPLASTFFQVPPGGRKTLDSVCLPSVMEQLSV